MKLRNLLNYMLLQQKVVKCNQLLLETEVLKDNPIDRDMFY